MDILYMIGPNLEALNGPKTRDTQDKVSINTLIDLTVIILELQGVSL